MLLLSLLRKSPVNVKIKVKQHVQRCGSPNTRLHAVTIEMTLYIIFRRYSFLKAFPWGLYPWLVFKAALFLFIQLTSTAFIEYHPPLFLPSSSLVYNLDSFSTSSYSGPLPPVTNSPSLNSYHSPTLPLVIPSWQAKASQIRSSPKILQ